MKRSLKMSDKDYLLQAYKVAQGSPDPSTQNGAVIPIGSGDGWFGLIEACNTFPPGVQITPERLQRPLKYDFVVHAEDHAILLAARRGLVLKGATMYVPWFACAPCARAIICSGIKKLVGHKRMFDATPDHWKESIANAFAMFKEAGVQTVLIEGELNGPEIRFNGSVWKP